MIVHSVSDFEERAKKIVARHTSIADRFEDYWDLFVAARTALTGDDEAHTAEVRKCTTKQLFEYLLVLERQNPGSVLQTLERGAFHPLSAEQAYAVFDLLDYHVSRITGPENVGERVVWLNRFGPPLEEMLVGNTSFCKKTDAALFYQNAFRAGSADEAFTNNFIWFGEKCLGEDVGFDALLLALRQGALQTIEAWKKRFSARFKEEKRVYDSLAPTNSLRKFMESPAFVREYLTTRIPKQVQVPYLKEPVAKLAQDYIVAEP